MKNKVLTCLIVLLIGWCFVYVYYEGTPVFAKELIKKITTSQPTSIPSSQPTSRPVPQPKIITLPPEEILPATGLPMADDSKKVIDIDLEDYE